MSSFSFFDDFRLQLGLKKHDFSADVLKLLLTNAAPSAAWTAISQATEITAEHGYSAGGIILTNTWSLVGSVATLAISSYTLTASGGTIGPIGYCILYNSSAGVSNNLIAYSDLRSINGGSSFTMLDTQTLGLGAFQLTI